MTTLEEFIKQLQSIQQYYPNAVIDNNSIELTLNIMNNSSVIKFKNS